MKIRTNLKGQKEMAKIDFLTDLALRIHESAKVKGLYKDYDFVKLMKQELNEYQNACIKAPDKMSYMFNDFVKHYELQVKNTKADELADLIILALGESAVQKIDIHKAVLNKMLYNEYRKR